jgi:hypothetical protein
MKDPPPCPYFERDPHQIFDWVDICRFFGRCAECRVNESGICRTQGLKVVSSRERVHERVIHKSRHFLA